MIKNNPIIKSTIVIFITFYLFIAIWCFLDQQIHMDDLINSLFTSISIIVTVICIGFMWTFGIFWLRKKSLLGDLNKKRSNGRYSNTQGNLPIIQYHKFSSVASTKKSLTPIISNWVLKSTDSESVYINLLLKVAGILKQNRKALAELNEPNLLYTHSKKVTGEILKLQQTSVDKLAIQSQFDKDENFNKYHLKIEDVIRVLNSPLMVVLGMCHDVGKLDSPIEPGQKLYLLDYGIRGRNLLAKLDETWLLPKDEVNDLFIVMANYNDYDKSPKLLQNGELIYKSATSTCLTMLLLHCHNLALLNNEETIEPEEDEEDFDNVVPVIEELKEDISSSDHIALVKINNDTLKELSNQGFTENLEDAISINEIFNPLNVLPGNTKPQDNIQPQEVKIKDLQLSSTIKQKSVQVLDLSMKENKKEENNQTIHGLFTSNTISDKVEATHHITKPQVDFSKIVRPNLSSKYVKSKIRETSNKPYSINNSDKEVIEDVSDDQK